MNKALLELVLDALKDPEGMVDDMEGEFVEKAYLATKKVQEALEKTTPIQVGVLEFVEMVYEKEHLVGRPIIWAQWPNEENT